MVNYINKFPLPETHIPEILRRLLSPVTIQSPAEMIPITTLFKSDLHGRSHELFHMMMASVPEDDASRSRVSLRKKAVEGVVSFSEPRCDNKADISDWSLSIADYEYIVASWGDGSFYSYSLAEKVWMALGLSSRVIGNNEQKLIYDDLSLPITGVAEGEVASQFYWQQSRNVQWTMRNDYLRRYLWMRGHAGVRVFYYEKLLRDEPSVRAVMQGKQHYHKVIDGDWCEVNIREHQSMLLLQVSASVIAVPPEECEKVDIYSLIWPGDTEPMASVQGDNYDEIYLKDTFLEKYEKNSIYDSVPMIDPNGLWLCSPSYRGQWGFEGCRRVGRNLITVPVYKLYKAVPPQEVQHAHSWAISNSEAEMNDFEEEHIVSKTFRLLEEMLCLSENLAQLSNSVIATGIKPEEFIEFDRAEVEANSILKYSIFQKLAQVAPREMYEQDFLARCKMLNETLCSIKSGSLRNFLRACNCPIRETEDLRSLKLLQGVSNILQYLNENLENADALRTCGATEIWKAKSTSMAPLFINNDLRNADAHETIGKSMAALEGLGFDSRQVDSGYGPAIDYIFDGIVDALQTMNSNARDVRSRSCG
jgi:hypothetical protein